MDIKTQSGVYEREVSTTSEEITYTYKHPIVPETTKQFINETQSIPYVPDISVSGLVIKRPIYEGEVLYKSNLPKKDKEVIKSQIIEFVVQLNNIGWAHRDLHTKNILWNGENIVVIDWEFVCRNPVPLEVCYDLTGKGLESPLNSQYMNVFSSNRASIKSMFPAIKLHNFIECQKTILT